MAKIVIDGKEYEVDGSDNLLHAALSKGIDVPYFCWHPALGSVGACRQCAVKQYKDETDTQGRLVMACMTPCGSGTHFTVNDPESKQFRASVVEWLMTNHPHDCPVCEEGGHCHLQDMTVMTGHSRRRYRFTKRTHRNQDLGPFVGHEMNRCIACYRCVRYYKDYAGGKDLGVFGAHDNVFFGRAEDGVLESEFSGNLTEVCPTGVFTDKTHSERYTRKWDMQFAPSICAGCSVGCNVSPGERYGEIRRVENRYHGDLNGYFLCDRGRFGYGYVNRKDRPRRAQRRHGQTWQDVSTDEALRELRSWLAEKNTRLIGIGSPRASMEANHALRTLVGERGYSTGLGAAEQRATRLIAESLGSFAAPSLTEVEAADAVLVLGEDVTQTAARLALAIRQAARGKAREMAAQKHIAEWQAEAVKDIGQLARHPVFILTPAATRLDDIATISQRGSPVDIALLAAAVAHSLDPQAPSVGRLAPEQQTTVQQIVAALSVAKHPLIVAGVAGGESAITAAMNVAQALKVRGSAPQLALMPAEANALGVSLLPGNDVEAALGAVTAETVLVVLENDLFRRAPATLVKAALQRCRHFIVIDHQSTETSERAHNRLPAATVFEGDGTFVNYEGRAQRHLQVFDPAVYDRSVATRESWRWLAALGAGNWKNFDEICAATASAQPQLAGLAEAAPSAQFRVSGLRLARAPHRQSGRTAQRAHLSVHEPRASQDVDSALNFSMEGYAGAARPAPLIPFAWAPSWNSPQAWNKFQEEVGGHLRGGDPGVRLIAAGAAANYRTLTTGVGGGGLKAIPLPDLFRSEEMSMRAAPIQARATAATLWLNQHDAATMRLSNGRANLEINGAVLDLPVQVSGDWPQGFIGIPQGAPGCEFVVAGTAVTVQVVRSEVLL